MSTNQVLQLWDVYKLLHGSDWNKSRRSFKSCKQIKRLHPKTTVTSENIPPFIYKGCSESLIKPLTYIFYLVITYKVYPATWKVGKVTPIPKTPSCNDITKFRPISILPVPGKIFESVIYQKTLHQVKNIISYSQHGFVPDRSVISYLCYFVHLISGNIDLNSLTDVICTDFQKAFDKVDHYILCQKLHHLTISFSY